MRRPNFETRFGEYVAEAWRKKYPKETARLEQTGQLCEVADRIADDACRILSEGLARGESFEAAERVAHVFASAAPPSVPVPWEQQQEDAPRLMLLPAPPKKPVTEAELNRRAAEQLREQMRQMGRLRSPGEPQ